MSRDDGWLSEDWFDETCGHYRLRCAPKGYQHGEYDELRSFHARDLRRLRGAGFLTPHGVAPDVLAAEVAARWRELGTDELVRWYVRTALVLLDARQARANREWHQRLARSLGFGSYYAKRAADAAAQGHPSFWALRKARGWA